MAEEIERSTLPTSPQQARQLLFRIREEERRKEEDIPEETKEELQGLREVTRDTLDNPSHVLPELLQNADDIEGECSKVTIELSEDALVFRNHKEPMAYENVEALGAFTKSTKRGDFDSIGYFGIGFKTVFSLTDTPYIHSGYFSFQYHTDAPTTPIDVEYKEQPATDSEWFDGTTIVLPFTDEKRADRREKVEEQLEDIGSLLPFLNNITTIVVHEYDQQRVYRRETFGQRGVRIVCEEDDEETVIERLRLFDESFEPRTDLLKKLADQRHLDAEAIQDRDPELEITIAVRIDDSGVPTAREGSLCGSDLRHESHLFCYFPTDADTHLPFDIQADFSLRPNREKIVWPDEFNEELLDHVPSLFADAFVQFHQEQASPSRILELVPDPKRERPSYLEPVVKKIISFVRDESCVPDQDNNLFQPNEVIFLQQPFRDLFSEKEVGKVLNREVQYPSEEISETARVRLRAIVDNSVVSVDDLLEGATDPTLYESKSNAWYVRFLAGINQYWRSEYQHTGLGRLDDETREARDTFEESLKRVPLLPLDDDGVTSYTAVEGKVYRLQQGYTDDYELFTDTDQLNLLSEDFLSAIDDPDDKLQDVVESTESLLFDGEPLSIPTLEPKDVVQEVINPAFESGSIEPDRADQYILFVSKRAHTLADKANVKLQTRSVMDSTADFRSPESLYLGSEYIDAYDSDTLFRPFEDLEPVSDHYLELGEKSRTEWADALSALGVTRRIEVCEQDPWESSRFKSQEKAEDFLRNHGDRGKTELHDERTLDGYNGQSGEQWMKRKKRYGKIKNYKYAFIDRYLPAESKEVLEKLTGDEAEPADVSFWREFMRMLDADWESYYQDKVYRVYRYSERTNKYRVKTGECACPTSFGLFLRNSAWCPGSDMTIHRASQLFIRNDQTSNKPVTFVEPQPNSSELIEFLEFQKHPGIQVSVAALQETIEKYNRDLDDSNVDRNEIERAIRSDLWAISRELDSNSGNPESHELDAFERLKQTPFIYVANVTPAFRTPSDVTWEGESLGEYLVPIEEIYTDFESLFIEELGVSREPTLQDCLSFLDTVNLTTVSEDDTEPANWSDALTAWSMILDEAVYISEDSIGTSDDHLKQARDSLKSDSRVPTAAKTLVNWNDVHFHTTDRTLLTNLPEEIQSKILHPERDERYTSEKYSQRLERLTGTEPLEPLLDTEILTDVDDDDQAGTLYSEYSWLFDAAYSYLKDDGTDSDLELLRNLSDAPVYKVEKLSCRYTVSNEYSATSLDISCLVDAGPEERQILLSSGDQAEFQLVNALVQEFELAKTTAEELVALLKGSFGKPDRMLRAYIEDSGYEYQQFPDTVTDSESSDETDESEGTAEEDSEESGSTGIDESDVDNTLSLNDENDTRPESEIPPNFGGNANQVSGLTDGEQQNQSDSDMETEPFEENNESKSPDKDNSNSSSDTNITSGLDDLTFSNKNSGGGGGREPGKSGKQGENFVLKQLRDAAEKQFQENGELKNTLTDSTGQSYTVQGEIDGDLQEIKIRDVSQQNLGYDVQLEGATLVNNQSELSISSVNEEETTHVEVKSSKKEKREFSLTPNEYKTAITASPDYVVVRIHTVRSDPKIDRVFYTLPKFFEQTNGTAVYPNGVTIEYSDTT